MSSPFNDATIQQVDDAMKRSLRAFGKYKKTKPGERADLLSAIAVELEINSHNLVRIAAKETFLETQRLESELRRTIFQLTSYGAFCRNGFSLDIRISLPDPSRNPPRPDLRKMLFPLGPVVVFGASNFPFAYSTAGGDTASALAAGCTVVVKAHPAHPHTSEMVSELIGKALLKRGMDKDVFIHLHGASTETGSAMVMHEATRAVGFTGSLQGGKALFDLANSRPVPIPVFAEMGSVNPVFILTGKLNEDAEAVASMYAQSITQSAGQFCTNPGILVGIKNDILDVFKNLLTKKMAAVHSQKMLHSGIAEKYISKRSQVLQQKGVVNLTNTGNEHDKDEGIPTLATVAASVFIKNQLLHQEIFGPFSLLVECRDEDEMAQVASVLEGQLTTTLLATENELKSAKPLMEALQNICGRIILNGVPTGVDVSLAMHHGGPYPASTDSRFSAVGADAIRRFARPLCFQNWTNEFLPDELKNENPLGLWRIVNDQPEKSFG